MGGIGHIPWSAAARFNELHCGGDLDELATLWRMLSAMDGVYLKDVTEKQKQERDKTKS